jgi:hypothetical protein
MGLHRGLNDVVRVPSLCPRGRPCRRSPFRWGPRRPPWDSWPAVENRLPPICDRSAPSTLHLDGYGAGEERPPSLRVL